MNIADAEVHYFLCIISILRCMWPPPHRAATATSKRRLLYHAKICRKKWCKPPVKANNRIKRHKNVQNSIHSFIHSFIKTLGHGSYDTSLCGLSCFFGQYTAATIRYVAQSDNSRTIIYDWTAKKPSAKVQLSRSIIFFCAETASSPEHPPISLHASPLQMRLST